jgi:hypothetical protein
MRVVLLALLVACLYGFDAVFAFQIRQTTLLRVEAPGELPVSVQRVRFQASSGAAGAAVDIGQVNVTGVDGSLRTFRIESRPRPVVSTLVLRGWIPEAQSPAMATSCQGTGSGRVVTEMFSSALPAGGRRLLATLPMMDGEVRRTMQRSLLSTSDGGGDASSLYAAIAANATSAMCPEVADISKTYASCDTVASGETAACRLVATQAESCRQRYVLSQLGVDPNTGRPNGKGVLAGLDARAASEAHLNDQVREWIDEAEHAASVQDTIYAGIDTWRQATNRSVEALTALAGENAESEETWVNFANATFGNIYATDEQLRMRVQTFHTQHALTYSVLRDLLSMSAQRAAALSSAGRVILEMSDVSMQHARIILREVNAVESKERPRWAVGALFHVMRAAERNESRWRLFGSDDESAPITPEEAAARFDPHMERVRLATAGAGVWRTVQFDFYCSLSFLFHDRRPGGDYTTADLLALLGPGECPPGQRPDDVASGSCNRCWATRSTFAECAPPSASAIVTPWSADVGGAWLQGGDFDEVERRVAPSSGSSCSARATSAVAQLPMYLNSSRALVAAIRAECDAAASTLSSSGGVQWEVASERAGASLLLDITGNNVCADNIKGVDDVRAPGTGAGLFAPVFNGWRGAVTIAVRTMPAEMETALHGVWPRGINARTTPNQWDVTTNRTVTCESVSWLRTSANAIPVYEWVANPPIPGDNLVVVTDVVTGERIYEVRTSETPDPDIVTPPMPASLLVAGDVACMTGTACTGGGRYTYDVPAEEISVARDLAGRRNTVSMLLNTESAGVVTYDAWTRLNAGRPLVVADALVSAHDYLRPVVAVDAAAGDFACVLVGSQTPGEWCDFLSQYRVTFAGNTATANPRRWVIDGYVDLPRGSITQDTIGSPLLTCPRIEDVAWNSVTAELRVHNSRDNALPPLATDLQMAGTDTTVSDTSLQVGCHNETQLMPTSLAANTTTVFVVAPAAACRHVAGGVLRLLSGNVECWRISLVSSADSGDDLAAIARAHRTVYDEDVDEKKRASVLANAVATTAIADALIDAALAQQRRNVSASNPDAWHDSFENEINIRNLLIENELRQAIVAGSDASRQRDAGKAQRDENLRRMNEATRNVSDAAASAASVIDAQALSRKAQEDAAQTRRSLAAAAAGAADLAALQVSLSRVPYVPVGYTPTLFGTRVDIQPRHWSFLGVLGDGLHLLGEAIVLVLDETIDFAIGVLEEVVSETSSALGIGTILTYALYGFLAVVVIVVVGYLATSCRAITLAFRACALTCPCACARPTQSQMDARAVVDVLLHRPTQDELHGALLQFIVNKGDIVDLMGACRSA